MRLLSTLTAPAVWFLGASTEVVLRLLGARTPEKLPITEREVEVLLEEGARAGVFEDEERDLARRALRLDDRPVRELMTPRPLISWLDADDPPEEHRRVVAESRHSYYPVARSDLGDLLGVTSVKDTWARAIAGEDADLLGELRQAPLVPEGAPATAALESFKRSGLPLALVILNDVLQALIGDLPDADSPEKEPIMRREDGSWLVDGLLAADELKARLGLAELPRETTSDYQTVGGMVMDNLGRVPAAGDQFDWAGFCFEVVDMDGMRVDKVLVAPAGTADAGDTER